jgi:hypothetical protein
MNNSKYRLSGSDQPFQTTIVVHGGTIFVKLIKSRNITYDIEYLASYTDALLEGKRLMDSIELMSREIAATGVETQMAMNFEADPVIAQIGDAIEVDDNSDEK